MGLEQHQRLLARVDRRGLLLAERWSGKHQTCAIAVAVCVCVCMCMWGSLSNVGPKCIVCGTYSTLTHIIRCSSRTMAVVIKLAVAAAIMVSGGV